MKWMELVGYPNNVLGWARETLNAAEEILPPEEDLDHFFAMGRWLRRLVAEGLITEAERAKLMYALSPNM